MLSLKIAVSQLLLISSLAMAQAAHTVFGTLPDGSILDAYTLHSSDVELRVITFGARVVSFKTKDRKGRFGDLALGYRTGLIQLCEHKPRLGADRSLWFEQEPAFLWVRRYPIQTS